MYLFLMVTQGSSVNRLGQSLRFLLLKWDGIYRILFPSLPESVTIDELLRGLVMDNRQPLLIELHGIG